MSARKERTLRRRVSRLASLLGASCVASVASAHHSSTTFYDYENFIEFEGEVTRVLWRNPHVQFSIMRTLEDGSREEWLADSSSVNSLQRAGFDRQLVSRGDDVRVHGPVSRQGLNAIRAVNLMLPSGEEYLMMAGQGVGFRWSEAARQVRGGQLPVPEGNGRRRGARRYLQSLVARHEHSHAGARGHAPPGVDGKRPGQARCLGSAG